MFAAGESKSLWLHKQHKILCLRNINEARTFNIAGNKSKESDLNQFKWMTKEAGAGAGDEMRAKQAFLFL